MSYLTAYRSQSSKYGGDGAKAFKPPPAPYKPTTRPPAANDNSPRPANDNFRTARQLAAFTRAGRKLIRVNPYLNAALTLWDIYDAVRYPGNNQTDVPFSVGSEWTKVFSCPRVGEPNGWRSAPSTPATTFCIGGQSAACVLGPMNANTTCGPVAQPVLSNHGWFQFYHLTGYIGTPPVPRFATGDAYARSTPGTQNHFKRVNPRRLKPVPVLSPDALPIYYPMPLPVPLPRNVVPHRVNDPIGSQRNNGQQRPRFVPRRPPPEGTKERKVRALSGLVGLIQSGGHVLTEGLDFLEALHDALPKEYQAKAVFRGGKWWNASPQAKAEAIYKNFDKMDLNEAVKNLIANEIGDRILGRANARVDQFLNRTPIGRVTRGVAF